MMLGTSYPVLVARDGDDWLRKVEPSIGDIVLADPATTLWRLKPPRVSACLLRRVRAITRERFPEKHQPGLFRRELAGLCDRGRANPALGRAKGRQCYGAIGVYAGTRAHRAKRAGVAAESLRVYSARFGPLPLKNVTIVGAPLVAGLAAQSSRDLGHCQCLLRGFRFHDDAQHARDDTGAKRVP